MRSPTALFCLLAPVVSVLAGTTPLLHVDFAKGPTWGAPHQLERLAVSADGTSFTTTGEDPWLVSPLLDVPPPASGAKRLQFTLTTAPHRTDGIWELFYAPVGRGFTAQSSVQFKPVNAQPPYDTFRVEIPLPAAFSGKMHLRLDPPAETGAYTVKSLTVCARAPLWTYRPETPPPLVIPAATTHILKGIDDGWELRHDPDRSGAFRIIAHGQTVENIPDAAFVYLDKAGRLQTLDWSQAPLTVRPLSEDGFVTHATRADVDGNVWQLHRRFTSFCFKYANGENDFNSLEIQTTVEVKRSTDRVKVPASVLHVPLLNLLVDRASQGHKHQACLAGVEYLADEPSSSDKEIRTYEHNRLIPDESWLTAPLAVFTDEKDWLAFLWKQTPPRRSDSVHPVAVVFDTPDRLFKSGGHLLGFWFPAVGQARNASELDIYHAIPFERLTHRVTLRMGPGGDVATAFGDILHPHKLLASPPFYCPPDRIDPQQMLATLAHGWLDSQIRDGLKVRHAINGNSFSANLVADAPCLMQYLATQLEDQSLAKRLRETAAQMRAALPKQDLGASGVSHVRRPAPVLLVGNVPAFLDAQAKALDALARELASGMRMRPAPTRGKEDLWSTLGADHCNGYTSMALDTLMGAAVWSGDEAAIDRALACADAARKLYHGTVPRGAQPWEMPLHTPDIMASAHLTRVYTLAYLLRGDAQDLAEARHWANSGLPFVTFQRPTYPTASPDPVGAYATCAVMGATHWVAPNWIGRPVQWCGLVYSAALYDLARIDRDSFWGNVARGITYSGLRQTYTAKDDPRYVGLLPDSWNLRAQNRFWCPINPGTVEENFAETLKVPYYSLRPAGSRSHAIRGRSPLIHAAGQVVPDDSFSTFYVNLWPEVPSQIVVTRIPRKPTSVTTRDGKPLPFEYSAARRVLIITAPARACTDIRINGCGL